MTNRVKGLFLLGLLLATNAWAGTYNSNGDGTVSYLNKRMWQQQDDGTTRTWEEAIAYCENLSLANYSDWRLPNYKELLSLTDLSRGYPTAIDPVFTGVKAMSYWSSTTAVPYTATPSAWTVSFADGAGTAQSKTTTSSIYVRCVRGGQ